MERLDPGILQGLRADAVTAEVVRELSGRGVPVILLKGPTLAELWGSQTRSYVDSDLLVDPAATGAAEAVLAQLGFEPQLTPGDVPGQEAHAYHWIRASDGANVDLHTTLAGLGADVGTAWRLLSADTGSIRLGDTAVPTLSLPARALHLALHAAQHGAREPKPIRDLSGGVERLPLEVWQEAARLARALEASPAFTAGLHQLSAGRALADRLGLEPPGGGRTALLAGSPPPVAVGLDDLMRQRGLLRRLALLARKAFPTRRFMRHWSPLARRGPGGLLLAYLWRPVWLLVKLPAGLAAWWRARG